MSADEPDPPPAPLAPDPTRVVATFGGVEFQGYSDGVFLVEREPPESDVTIKVSGLNPLQFAEGDVVNMSNADGSIGRGRVGVRHEGTVTVTLMQTAPNTDLLDAIAPLRDDRFWIHHILDRDSNHILDRDSNHIRGVGAIRVGDLRLTRHEIAPVYQKVRHPNGGKWMRVAGVPNHRGIGNRHDFARWCKRTLAPACLIAHDAMLDGRRDLALGVLCAVVPLGTAVAWTEPDRTSNYVMLDVGARVNTGVVSTEEIRSREWVFDVADAVED